MKRNVIISISGCNDCPWRDHDRCKRLHIAVENEARINPACDYSYSREEDYLIAVENSVTKIFGLTLDSLKKPDKSYRSRDVVKTMARGTIYKLLYERGVWSLGWIGNRYNRNHATVLNGIRKINNVIDTRDMIWYSSVMSVYADLGIEK